MSIGGKLKELRILKGLTQEELADRAELSKGFISQVERDLTSPSIATLMDILQCLGTTIGEFFNEAPEEQIVFEKNDYFIKEDPELKNEIQWIIPNAQKNTMEPIRLTLGVGGSTYPDSRMRVRNLATFFRQHPDSSGEPDVQSQKRANLFTIRATRRITLKAAPARRSSGSARRQVSNTTHYFTIYGGNA